MLDESTLKRILARGGTIEVSTASFDPDRQGVGSSPFQGEAASSGLFVPQTPTVSLGGNPFARRYLFRLCGMRIAGSQRVCLRGVRQRLTIGQAVAFSTRDPVDDWTYPMERDVRTPGWAFQDGNVSWHLHVVRGRVEDPGVITTGQAAGTSPLLYEIEPALIYDPTLGAPIPPNAGMPPGEPLGDLGSFYDMRFPWYSQGTLADLEIDYDGSLDVCLYASVRQTNPATRPVFVAASAPVTPLDLGALVKEERFLQAFPGALYRHIAGALILDVGPLQSHPDRSCP